MKTKVELSFLKRKLETKKKCIYLLYNKLNTTLLYSSIYNKFNLINLQNILKN